MHELSVSVLNTSLIYFILFFFNAPAPTELYTLSLHDALPISPSPCAPRSYLRPPICRSHCRPRYGCGIYKSVDAGKTDRKSTRLNSSHQIISYAVFCLKKKKKKKKMIHTHKPSRQP